MRISLAALLASALIAAPGFAGKLIVDAVETNSREFTLPASTSSSVTIKRCGHCPVRTITASAQTVYEIAGRRVTLEELKKIAADTPLPLFVHYRVEDGALIKIKVP